MKSSNRYAEFDRLVEACVRWHTSEQAEPSAYYDAELEYCKDMILFAAKAFVAAHSDGEACGNGS